MAMTRKQYMGTIGHKSHIEYYRQYVTDDVIKWVVTHIGLQAVTQSRDLHFNDIPLEDWEMPATAEIRQKMRRLGETNATATMVCVTKAAAEGMRQRHREASKSTVILDLEGGLVTDRHDEGIETEDIRVLIRDYDVEGIDPGQPDYDDLKMDNLGRYYLEKWL